MFNFMHYSANSKQRGVGLIEVMVAILLLAMGLLGALALQFSTAKEQRSSQFVARAALLGNEIAERMRINRAGIEAGLYDMSSTPTYAAVRRLMVDNPSVQFNCNPMPSCATPAWQAQLDVGVWWQSTAATLPQAAAIVLPVQGTSMLNARDIVLAWVEPVVDRDNEGQSVKLKQSAKNNGCPDIVDAPEGVRCYQFRFVL